MRIRFSRPFLAGLLLAAAPAHAQQDLFGPGAGFIAIGAARIGTGDLDARLAANGYPSYGQTAFSVGAGAYRLLSSGLMLGGEFNALFIGSEEQGGRTTGVGGGQATLGVAWTRELTPRIRVYPRFGLGAGGIALWFDNAPDTVEFDDVLGDPRPVSGDREPVLSRDGVVIDLGAGGEFRPRGASGFLIGLRLGYLLADFGSETDWQLFGNTARNGPKATIAGPYVRLMIGGAWRR